MLACLKTAIGNVEMRHIPVPEPGPGQIVVRMSMTTICGSDMHFLDEVPNEALAPVFPGVVLAEGMLMGHEGVGVVHTAGEGVTSFAPGDRVMAACITSCGRCRECLRRDYSMCTGDGLFGRPIFGCQAEYYVVPHAEMSAVKVPEEISDEEAVLASDILSTGFGAIERADAGFGDSVAIFAQGPVGLCATMGARLRGCGLIIAVDTIPQRLEISKRLGANVVVNARESDPIAAIMLLTNNAGVDIAVEAVGTQATFEACTRAVRRGGTISSVGIYTAIPSVSMSTIVPSFLHRRVITTTCPSGRDRMQRMLDLIRHNDIDFSPLYSHRLKLADCPRAYEMFRAKADGVLKFAITP